MNRLTYPLPCDCQNWLERNLKKQPGFYESGNNETNCIQCTINSKMTDLLKQACFYNWDTNSEDSFFTDENETFLETSFNLQFNEHLKKYVFYQNKETPISWLPFKIAEVPEYIYKETNLVHELNEGNINLNEKKN